MHIGVLFDFDFPLSDQTALVVLETNKNEVEKYGAEVEVIPNSIKVSG